MDQHSLGTLPFLNLSREAIEAKQKLEKNRAKCNERFVDSGVLIEHAKKGDLIEFKRPLPIAIDYSHWGVYVGEGNVIHVTDIKNGKGTVRKQCLKDVANKSLCRVNNLFESAQENGLVNPKSPEEIVETAENLVGKEFEYDVIKNNCEHFATFCRYGKKFSDQVDATDNSPTIRTAVNMVKSSQEAKASGAKSSTNTRKE